MCLAVPMKVIEISANQARAEVGGVIYRANLDLLSDVRIGDYIIVHAGFAIEKLDEETARENLAIWQEIATLAEQKERRTAL